MIFDYIALHYFIALITGIFVLRTNRYLNAIVWYSFAMGAFVTLFPFFRKQLPVALIVSIQNQTNLYLAYLLCFVILIKTKIPSERLYKILSMIAVFSVVAS